MSSYRPDVLSADSDSGLKVFGGSSVPLLAREIVDSLGIQLGEAKIGRFPDGETMIKLEDDVRGRDCFVVQSTCPPVNENLMELLIFIDSLRRASARRITAVIPYFGYARQDRKSEGRTPITAKLVANLISQAGAHRVLAMDLHAEQIQGFFDLPLDHLAALPVIASHIETMGIKDYVVVSPDVGNLKRATAFVEWMGGEIAVIDKRRVSGEEIVAARVIGDVQGKTVLLFDDMITTAGTATGAVKILREHGAEHFLLAATHAVLAEPAIERLDNAKIDWIITTNTIPLRPKAVAQLPQIEVLSVANLFGEAIRRIHLDLSISTMLKKGQRGQLHTKLGMRQ